MDKESIYELQKTDCNCSDCGFMKRDLNKYNQSLEFHKQIQLEAFERNKQRQIKIAKEWKNKGELEIWNDILMAVDKMKFQFDKSGVTINYGICEKFNKDVSFIPNRGMNNQDCFKHRRGI